MNAYDVALSLGADDATFSKPRGGVAQRDALLGGAFILQGGQCWTCLRTFSNVLDGQCDRLVNLLGGRFGYAEGNVLWACAGCNNQRGQFKDARDVAFTEARLAVIRKVAVSEWNDDVRRAGAATVLGAREEWRRMVGQ